MALPPERCHLLLGELAYDRTERWTASTLRMDTTDFAALVMELRSLENSGDVDIVSISHEPCGDGRRASAITFVRLRRN